MLQEVGDSLRFTHRDRETGSVIWDTWRRVRVYVDVSTGVVCEVENGRGEGGSVALATSQIWADMTGYAGLRVYEMEAQFQNLVIYR